MFYSPVESSFLFSTNSRLYVSSLNASISFYSTALYYRRKYVVLVMHKCTIFSLQFVYLSIKSSVGENLTRYMLYKCWICLWLYFDGDGGGKGTHISLFFVIMKSEYIDLLT